MSDNIKAYTVRQSDDSNINCIIEKDGKEYIIPLERDNLYSDYRYRTKEDTISDLKSLLSGVNPSNNDFNLIFNDINLLQDMDTIYLFSDEGTNEYIGTDTPEDFNEVCDDLIDTFYS